MLLKLNATLCSLRRLHLVLPPWAFVADRPFTNPQFGRTRWIANHANAGASCKGNQSHLTDARRLTEQADVRRRS